MTMQIATTKKRRAARSCSSSDGGRKLWLGAYTLNEEPQPHVLETLGLPNLKPAPIAPST